MAATNDSDPKARLKQLRDKLAVEAPRARTNPVVPKELTQRMQSTLDSVSAAYLLAVTPENRTIVEEAREDAIAEAHLVLHEWERWVEQRETNRVKPRASAIPDRRIHTRIDTSVTVRLLRYAIHSDDTTGTALEAETLQRPARNVSLGGIFVALDKGDLPKVGVGNIVHVSVTVGVALTFRARAAVARRVDDGIGLHWIQDTEAVKRSVKSLLDAVTKR
jgi:hypothetical protein